MHVSVKPHGTAQSCVGLTPRVRKRKSHVLSMDQPDAKTRPAERELPVPTSDLKIQPRSAFIPCFFMFTKVTAHLAVFSCQFFSWVVTSPQQSPRIYSIPRKLILPHERVLAGCHYATEQPRGDADWLRVLSYCTQGIARFHCRLRPSVWCGTALSPCTGLPTHGGVAIFRAGPKDYVTHLDVRIPPEEISPALQIMNSQLQFLRPH